MLYWFSWNTLLIKRNNINFNFLTNQNSRGLGFELANHLGNVLNVVTDRKLPVADQTDPTKVAYFTADVLSYSDYLPFGQIME